MGALKERNPGALRTAGVSVAVDIALDRPDSTGNPCLVQSSDGPLRPLEPVLAAVTVASLRPHHPAAKWTGTSRTYGRAFGWIKPLPSGLFVPSEDGVGVFTKLLDVFEPDSSEPVDTVAWAFGGRSPWWLCNGTASYLGAFHLWRRDNLGRPVRLVPTPADWLADVGQALCILDWSRPVLPLLLAVGAVVPTTPALGRRLAAAVTRDRAAGLALGRNAA
jgi:hypothetical protein